MAWYVYLAECGDGSLYCGVTTRPERRLAQHNGLIAGGAKYTRARRPVRLAALAECADQGAALRLEEAVKRVPRRDKLDLLRAAAASAAAGTIAE